MSRRAVMRATLGTLRPPRSPARARPGPACARCGRAGVPTDPLVRTARGRWLHRGCEDLHA